MIDQLIDLMKRRGYTVVDSIDGNSWEFSVKDLERADMFLLVNSDWRYCTKPVMKGEYISWRMGK
jgi:hypothetical protein